MLPFVTTLSAETARTVPTVFSTDSVEGRSPVIRHPDPVGVEQSSGLLAIGSGCALHATLSAGVAAKAGIASVSGRTEISIRVVLVIDAPVKTARANERFRSYYTTQVFPGTRNRSNKKALPVSPAALFLERPLRGTFDFVVREAGLEPAHPCGRQDLNLVRLPISPLTRISVA